MRMKRSRYAIVSLRTFWQWLRSWTLTLMFVAAILHFCYAKTGPHKIRIATFFGGRIILFIDFLFSQRSMKSFGKHVVVQSAGRLCWRRNNKCKMIMINISSWNIFDGIEMESHLSWSQIAGRSCCCRPIVHFPGMTHVYWGWHVRLWLFDKYVPISIARTVTNYVVRASKQVSYHFRMTHYELF